MDSIRFLLYSTASVLSFMWYGVLWWRWYYRFFGDKLLLIQAYAYYTGFGDR